MGAAWSLERGEDVPAGRVEEKDRVWSLAERENCDGEAN
jgi:hypothetical protein